MVEFGVRAVTGDVYGRPDLQTGQCVGCGSLFQPSLRTSKFNEYRDVRDGFFVPAGTPYTYRPGPEGVELLEFRHATHFDFRLHVNNEAFWKKGAETVAKNRADWETAKMPPLNA